MKKTVKAIATIMLFMGIFLFPGCIRIERELDIRSNNSVILTLKYVEQEQFINMMYDSMDEFYADMENNMKVVEGYSSFSAEEIKTTIGENDAYGYCIKGKLPLKKIGSVISKESLGFDITNKGFIKKTVRINIISEISDKYDKYGKFTSQIEDDFSVRVPGKIIDTNGFKDENDSRRITWNIADAELNKTDHMELYVSYIDYKSVAVLVISILIFIATIIAVLIIIKKKGNKNSNNLNVSI